MVEQSVIESVQKYIRRLSDEGLLVNFAVLFGSYASGKADYLSDIDLIVVSPQFDGSISREYIKKLWQVAAKTDSRIEPIPCGKIQWQIDNSNTIIEIARLEGLSIPAA